MSTGRVADFSGTITVGGTSQQVLPARAAGKGLEIENPTTATEDFFFNFGAAASLTAAGSYSLVPGGSASYSAEEGFLPTDALHVIAATTGHVFVVKIW